MATQERVEEHNFAERGLRFLRDLHLAIGVAALGGAVLLQSSFLGAVAGYEAVNVAVHEGARRVVAKPKNQRYSA